MTPTSVVPPPMSTIIEPDGADTGRPASHFGHFARICIVTGIHQIYSPRDDPTLLTEGTYSRHLAIDKPAGRLSPDPSTQSVLITTEITREVVERPFVKMAVAVVGATKAKTQPTEVDVRLLCPPEILRALRSEQVVPRVTVRSTAASGSESLPVEVSVDKCEAHITPSSVIVRW